MPAQLKRCSAHLKLCSSQAHSGFIAGSIETLGIIRVIYALLWLIPALLPAQLKLHIFLTESTDTSGLIPALLPAQLKRASTWNQNRRCGQAHSGFIAGSIETCGSLQQQLQLSSLIPALLPAQLKHKGRPFWSPLSSSLIPALLPAQLKPLVICIDVNYQKRLIPALLPAQLKLKCLFLGQLEI